ncbi:MAG: hypothetical protein CM15mP102_07830 [Flavobacteriales bacterium]|nr:MAG: hypothetical protein CM15mP102_07830 [Flavobacteriales bacterium]
MNHHYLDLSQILVYLNHLIDLPKIYIIQKYTKVRLSDQRHTSSYIYQLERQIISILLKYGVEEIQFEDIILNKDEDGKLVEIKEY